MEPNRIRAPFAAAVARWGMMGICLAVACGDDGSSTMCPPGFMAAGPACVRADGGGDCSEEEVCDGFDNDCDGAFDEFLTRSCGMDVGACTIGIEACTDGVFGECTGIEEAEESCELDGDEDCDGAVDEGCPPCSPGDVRGCGSDVGACSLGMQSCRSDSNWGSCSGGSEPGDETCNAVDDDCDGTTDEETGGASCGTDVGACAVGTEACVAGALECSGGVEPVDEECNGVDDDCNGSIDEGLDRPWYPDVDMDGRGDLDATPVVQCAEPAGFVANDDDCDDSCAVCWTGATEVCDAEDNDCSGTVDTDGGFACVRNMSTACTTSCGTTGIGTCSTSCGLPTGDDCAPPAEVCDEADQDCDGGVDEGTRSLSGARTPAQSNVVETRVVPRTGGFVLYTLSSNTLRAQRLDLDAVPVGSPVTIANNVGSFDADQATGNTSVAFYRTLSDAYAQTVTATGAGLTTSSAVAISTRVSAIGGVAVAATATKVRYVYVQESSNYLTFAATTTSLGSVVRDQSARDHVVRTGINLTQVEIHEASGAFTVACIDANDRLVVGRLDDSFLLVLTDHTTQIGMFEQPVIADDGSGNRVLAVRDGSQLEAWYLPSGSYDPRGELTGTPPLQLENGWELGPVADSLYRVGSVAWSGGRWVFVTVSGTVVSVREVEARDTVIDTDTIGLAGLQAADIAANGLDVALGIGRASAETQSSHYGCN